jgi:hypothetical protein
LSGDEVIRFTIMMLNVHVCSTRCWTVGGALLKVLGSGP